MNKYFKNFNQLFLAAFLAVAHFFCPCANAQYVELMLEIQSKSSLRVIGAENNISNGLVKQSENVSEKKIRPVKMKNKPATLIEITTPENIQMGVEVIPQDSAYIGSTAYLNSGKADVFNAVPFRGRRAVFNMDNSKMPVKDKIEGAKFFSAWIVLPPGAIRHIIFEYH